MLGVPIFRPWVGKIDVDRGDGRVWDVSAGEGEPFGEGHDQVFQAFILNFRPDLFCSIEPFFYGQPVDLWMSFCLFDDPGAVSAAILNPNIVRRRKQLLPAWEAEGRSIGEGSHVPNPVVDQDKRRFFRKWGSDLFGSNHLSLRFLIRPYHTPSSICLGGLIMPSRGIKLLLGLVLFVPIFGIAEKPFVIGSLMGRIGNQMFEIATASAVAWDNGAEAYFPSLNRSSDEFRHIFFRCKTETPSAPVEFEWSQPVNWAHYSPVPFHPNMRMFGYYQNEKYFFQYRDRLLKLFKPRRSDLEYIQKTYTYILDDPKSVGVHLRCFYSELGRPSIQYEREYFTKAMALFPKDSLFVVTSDNIEFARQNIPTDWGRVVFIESEPAYIDFFLQTLCKNNIMSNSTFSWWCAWLNENPSKIVVRPSFWMPGEPDIECPDDWIRVDAARMDEVKQASLTPENVREILLSVR